MFDITKSLSLASRRTKSSAIRELLKLTAGSDLISLAGGLPAPETFPVAEVTEIISQVIKERSRTAFQYAPTEGMPEFRDAIVNYLRQTEGLECKTENILVTTSSQQALDLVARVFVDPTDPVLVELPTYLGGLQAFEASGAHLIGVKGDSNGMDMEDLEAKLMELKRTKQLCKFVYIVPDFQNPTGTTLTVERRQKLVELAKRYRILIVEDTPYRDVRFAGKKPPMVQSFDPCGHVVSFFTLSKILFPGFRLGFILGHEEVIRKLTVMKQALDLCSPSFNQLVVAEYMNRGLLQAHLPVITDNYRKKMAVMLKTLAEEFANIPGVTWTQPEGGLFLLLRLPEDMDTEKLFPIAVREGVAYVIGAPFHCDGSGQHTMRLNFSFPSEDQIREGIKRLARAVRTFQETKAKTDVMPSTWLGA